MFSIYGIFYLLFSYLPSSSQDQLSAAQCPSQCTMEVWHKPQHDFQTDGNPASWFPEHPKQWGSEIARIEFPLPTQNRTIASYLSHNYITLSDDDRLLAIAVGEDIHVYTVQRSGSNGDEVNLQQKRIFHSAHGGSAVSFVEFQPGGSALLVSWGMPTDCSTRENTIKVWDMKGEDSLGLVAEAAKHTSQLLPQQNSFHLDNGSALQNAMVRRQAFSHDGSLLLVFPDPGLNGRSVTVVAVDGFHERYQLVGHSDNVIWAEFSPDDRFIATSSWDKTVRIWNAVNGDLIHILRGANGQSWQGAFSPDGKLVAVGAGDTRVRIWNVESGELLHTLHGFTGWIRSLHFSPDGKVLAAGAAAGTLRVFDVLTGESIQYWQAATEQHYFLMDTELADVQYTIHGLLVFNSADGQQYTFDARTNQKGLFEDGQNPGKYASSSGNSVVSSDGSLLFTADSDRSIRVWRL